MITYFKDIYTTDKPHYTDFDTVYKRTKEGVNKATCEKVREGDKQSKLSLPVILFAGKFSDRSNAGLISLSGVVVIDFDHLGDRMAQFRERIISDKYTMMAFVSPSGDGYKVVVKIPKNKETYKQSCRALKDYYKDEALNHFDDVARACFESYDPEIFYNPTSEVFELLHPKEEFRSIKTTGVSANFEESFDRLRLWLEGKLNFHYIDGQKHTFLVRFASACNRFGLDREAVLNRLYNAYGGLADVPMEDFRRIVSRVYTAYANQYATSFFDEEGSPQNNNEEQITDEVFELIAKDVIYLDQIKDRMLSTFHTGMNQGETTYFNTIDPHFKWMKKDMTMMGGIGNHGKSTLLIQLCMKKSMEDGDKWTVFSPEQDPPDYFYNDLIHTYVGKPVDKFFINQCSEAEYKRGMDFVKNHFFYVNPTSAPNPKYIRDRFEETISKHNVTGVIIDPFNQLDNDWRKHGGRDDRYLSEFLSEHKRWGSDHNLYNLMVAHPNGSLPKKPDGNYDCPDLYDYAGGAMWPNKLDNMLATYRPYYTTDKASPIVEFRSQKIKKQKLVGITGNVTLSFDRMSNRFLENKGEYQEGGVTKTLWESPF